MRISEHFDSKEFECRCGCGFKEVSKELLLVLETLRSHFNKPVHINSGCRCDKHNKEVGGVPEGPHTKGIAADIVVIGEREEDVVSYLESLYPNKYGIGRYEGRTHIDVRSKKARWKG